MATAELADTFSALGDATRFAIVERLLNEGELCVGRLRQGLTISPPAVSRHLKVLRRAGVIQQRVDGQRRMYSVRPEAVLTISAWTMSHRDFWQSSLDRLEQVLVQESRRK
jgi:DNA-binding transcriptional ArsR family regulator